MRTRRLLLLVAVSALSCGRSDTLETLLARPTEGGGGASPAALTCQDRPAISVEVGGIGPPLDVLIVVDNSGDMGAFQDRLADAAPALIDGLAGLEDYQIGVVSTDLRSRGGEQVGDRMSQFSGTFPNTVTSFDTSDCGALGTPHGCLRGEVARSDQSRDRQVEIVARNVRAGTCGDGANESGLGATVVALRNSRGGGCAEEFFREEASLAVLVLSNEDDATPGEPSVEEILGELERFKNVGRARFGFLVAAENGRAVNCGAAGSRCGSLCDTPPPPGSGRRCRRDRDCPQGESCGDDRCGNIDLEWFQFCNWCSYYAVPDCCSALAGDRYVEFARQFAARAADENPSLNPRGCAPTDTARAACMLESICQSDYTDVVRRFTRDVLPRTAQRVFQLNIPITSSGAMVRLAGAPLRPQVDYEISPDGTTLRILDAAQPQIGARVEVFCPNG